jgi:alkaline phosphatase D
MRRASGRRRFLEGSLATGAGLLLAGRRGHAAPPLVVPDSSRPTAIYGAAAGDVSGDRAVVWSRTDRPARMYVEYSTSGSFAQLRRVPGPAALEETGFTARVELAGLPPGQRIAYRVLFQDLTDLRIWSLPVTGTFLSAPAARRDVSFAWSADTVGQGWGINPEWGGLRIYETVRRAAPDFFVHCGDTIYADNPLSAEVKLDDGTLWRNLVTPAKAKVAESLDEFRGNHLYNLIDENVRRFNAEIPLVVLWDDHDVLNNWYPDEVLKEGSGYQGKSVALLAARAQRAFLEHYPIRIGAEDPERIYRSLPYGPSLEVFALDLRSYRGSNSPNRQAEPGPPTAILGRAQVMWLADRLAASPATWKVIASDQPIGLMVGDGPTDFEGIANGDGPPLGRELEIALLLKLIRDRGVRNVVWLTGDVHYAAAHHYDPARARFKEFRPFWEFVAGPLHAGTFGPNALDDTFGPEVRFVGIPPGMKPNRPPGEGLQFFGRVQIDGRTETMTVKLHDLGGRDLFSVELEPDRA